MTTVACVLRSGGVFTVNYVHWLARGVARNLRGHRFVCLTDLPADSFDLSIVYPMPLAHMWPGWWSKLEIFRLYDDVVLFFDLDTVIVGDLQPIVDAVKAAPGLCMIRDFYRKYLFQSGVMGWRNHLVWPLDMFPPAQTKAGWEFAARRGSAELRVGSETFRGDGEWLRHQAVKSTTSPMPGIVSYKVHVRGKSLPKDASVVCFHGKPRPHEVNPKPDWMKTT